MDASQVIAGLRSKHPKQAWLFVEEFANSYGFNWTRHYDVFCIALWEKLGHERRVYEVKVSRSDFQSEIKKPQKRQSALANSNTFYFATPYGMVDKDEIPEECGLIWVREDGSTHTVKKAPFRKFEGDRESEKVNYHIFMSLANRAADAMHAEHELRRYKRKEDKRESNNLAHQVLYHYRSLVKAGEDIAHPVCLECSGIARRSKHDYTPTEEDEAAYTAETGRDTKGSGYWAFRSWLRKFWDKKFALEYHRLAIKRLVYKRLNLELPEHEREETDEERKARIEQYRKDERERKKQAKIERERKLAEFREKHKIEPAWVQE